MAYPIEERLKNLEAVVEDLRDSHYYAHPIEDTTFEGIITDIDVSVGFLTVQDVSPTADAAGNLTFPTTGSGKKNKVYVANVTVANLTKYYQVNDIVAYWCVSGKGPHADEIRGTYVTVCVLASLPHPRNYLTLLTTINDSSDVAFVLPTFSGI
jgi:hypothetical protein